MSENDPRQIWLELGDTPPDRLDKALAAIAPESLGLSRSRLTKLMRDGAVRDAEGHIADDPKRRPEPGARFVLSLPEIAPLEARPEVIKIDIVHEDADLIIVNKPAGMVVHPAPGAEKGTLVNALLHHCGDSLSGIGGVMRPGIVHRIDKDTSGLLVIAKNDRAHRGLAQQFAKHSVTRVYDALIWGVPRAADPRLSGMGAVRFEEGGVVKIAAPIGRHPADRKKMAVREGGRHAVTRMRVEKAFGEVASWVTCRLETGRTHQIRVHLTHIGHALVGDPVYGRARSIPQSAPESFKGELVAFRRQALHAGVLGFEHPTQSGYLEFSRPIPEDMGSILRRFEEVF